MSNRADSIMARTLDRGSDSPRSSRTSVDRETKRERERERERERDRDDMVAKARDQTRMIITGVVNTSLEVILF